ncbi:hypothetical protein HK104_005034 [Borealophlyctis nickersoniae]|nr:hypothetical protein HK104_005034 [Borealophlyctis nickersoniae]
MHWRDSELYLQLLHIVTWKHIVAFLASTFEPFKNDLEGWILHSDLFDAAYVAVVADPKRWFWSVQLLNFTAALMVFYWSEGSFRAISKRGGSYVAAFVYVWLGFLGAISVSFAFFLVQKYAIEKSARLSSPGRPSALMSVAVVLALLSVAVTPYIPANSPIFGYNLKVLHVLLSLPILIATGPALWSRGTTERAIVRGGNDNSPASLYAFLSGASLLSHLHLSLTHLYGASQGGVVGTQGFRDLFDAVFDNACQVSISADLLFTTIIAICFIILEIGHGQAQRRLNGFSSSVIGLALITATPFVSISTTFPAFLAWREGWRAVDKAEKEKER